MDKDSSESAPSLGKPRRVQKFLGTIGYIPGLAFQCLIEVSTLDSGNELEVIVHDLLGVSKKESHSFLLRRRDSDHEFVGEYRADGQDGPIDVSIRATVLELKNGGLFIYGFAEVGAETYHWWTTDLETE